MTPLPDFYLLGAVFRFFQLFGDTSLSKRHAMKYAGDNFLIRRGINVHMISN